MIEIIKNEIDIINNIFLQKDKNNIFVKELQNLLLLNIKKVTKDKITDLIKAVANNQLTKEEVYLKLKKIENEIGIELQHNIKEEFEKHLINIYKTNYKDIGIKFLFNNLSKKVINYLHTDTLYWIGKHYSDNLSNKIMKNVENIMQSGLGRAEAGLFLQEAFKNYFKKDISYWEGLANHIVTKTQSFARVTALKEANIKEFVWVSIIDNRTSLICQEMNGRVIKTEKGFNLIEKYLNADNPEQAKEISPFYTDEMVIENIAGKTKLPDNIAFPPAHFYCRSRILAKIN